MSSTERHFSLEFYIGIVCEATVCWSRIIINPLVMKDMFHVAKMHVVNVLHVP